MNRWEIVSKSEGRQIGYWKPYGENDPQNTVTVQDVSHDDEYWQGIKYTVEDGDVIQFGE